MSSWNCSDKVNSKKAVIFLRFITTFVCMWDLYLKRSKYHDLVTILILWFLSQLPSPGRDEAGCSTLPVCQQRPSASLEYIILYYKNVIGLPSQTSKILPSLTKAAPPME